MKRGLILFFGLIPFASTQAQLLARHYKAGEEIFYQMHGKNLGRERSIEYEAKASGVVKTDGRGTFFEEFAWSDLRVNQEPFAFSPASSQFREALSLDPAYKLTIPDLSKVQPMMIGPITDLLTFYADLQLAMQQKNLLKAGDHAFFKHGLPNSWADGSYVVRGEDAIDFDITLKSVDEANQTAKIVVRHVPPVQCQIKLPAAWMETPVSDTPNNWLEVEKSSNGKFVAQVGQETFDVKVTLALASGRILSAVMDNPVAVLERDCDDAALSTCGEPHRYSIHREIRLEAVGK